MIMQLLPSEEFHDHTGTRISLSEKVWIGSVLFSFTQVRASHGYPLGSHPLPDRAAC